ncbi:hypothetical protein CI109_102784 [Kwoniella shandongensis]|uniref:Uncharacterized protein n=1 Tax=Kwoniella shandongensis TaxID=1734106 RepID=A0A5M6BXR2_9TREE|nr:uncharacterized protein CI109_004895 [Kwoniella shandongensis]KAA5526692.1 hypothetical protein CI109_004895 [Kwoniella shandongensis]
MIALKALLSLGLVAAVAQAIQITLPNNSSGWETSGAKLIQWTSVSTDPSNFTITLSPPGDSTKTPIEQNVQTSSGSIVYPPLRDLSPGDGYRISFVSADGGILAQSDQFSVKTGTSTVSATSSQSSSASAASTTAAGTQSSGNAASSAATSAAATTAPSSGADNLAIPSVLLLLVGGVVSLFA